MECKKLVKEIRQLESELQTFADSKQGNSYFTMLQVVTFKQEVMIFLGLISSFADSNVHEMNTFMTNIRKVIAEQKKKEQEDIDQLISEFDPNSN